ncbi:diguanylate cyclase domain-containing protein [Demequina sp. SO4-18]|uniref:GGDEF domain-containing protein n=1 Tax=Demequina sp. SO4-18 TaxID=3401026 RepID=UPI003B5B4C65
MLDDQTMRLVLGGVTLTVLLLFYLGVYRPTRSSFSGWWTLTLLCAAMARLLLLFNGSDLQVITNSASIVLAVIGVTSVWFATRSLRRERLPLWLLGAAPVVILVPRILEAAAGGVWLGNRPLFLYMAVMFVAGTVETWLAWRSLRVTDSPTRSGEPVVALLVTAIAGTVFAGFYAVRAVTQVVGGPGGSRAELAGFAASESVLLLVCLVAVTFSVSAVGWDQQTRELRRRAMQDDLTGLLGRTEFRLQADQALSQARSRDTTALLVVADLDQFKEVNDVQGHPAGDEVLIAFAAALRGALGPGEFAGRQGGDEFGFVLLDTGEPHVAVRLAAVGEAYRAYAETFDFALPTVSFGIAGPDDGDSLAEIYEHADLALYRAKSDGRDRAVRYSREAPRRTGRVPSTEDARASGPGLTGVV